jgi:hypothetical protein
VPDILAELFSSRVRAAVLAMILARPHLAFSLTDLSRRLGLPVSSLQHECYKLVRIGVLRDERAGNARLYRPNAGWPLLAPLTALTVHALPLEDALRGAVERVPGVVEVWVTDSDASAGPVYLVVIGELAIEALDGIFERSRLALAPWVGLSRLELAYFRPGDWASRLSRDDPFAASLLATRWNDICIMRNEEQERSGEWSG